EYTGRINRIGTEPVLWSRSYFAGSCGGAPLTVIRQYIEEQKQSA
ncbi:transposase, partial [Streptomyces sp. NPDC056231]